MGVRMEEDQGERRRAQLRESQRRRRAGEPLLRGPAQHPSHGGVKSHRRAGESLCEACAQFERERKRKK